MVLLELKCLNIYKLKKNSGNIKNYRKTSHLNYLKILKLYPKTQTCKIIVNYQTMWMIIEVTRYAQTIKTYLSNILIYMFLKSKMLENSKLIRLNISNYLVKQKIFSTKKLKNILIWK